MADPMPNVDELFPAKPQSVDELFPADVERERYRRATLGTSPIQDLIFGGTDVNPIARVLDHFGQGAKQGWGAEPSGLSQESADALKKAGIFNDYDKGQKSIIKAMNESLFRGAAVALYDPLFRGLPAAFRGAQEAIAQTGEELGQPQLGREAAGALEAFPMGFRQPTGMPGAPVAQMGRGQQLARAERNVAVESEIAAMEAELARARDMGVIGAGEAGWKGTAEVPAPTIKEQAAAVKPEVMESGMHQPVEVTPGEVKPAPEVVAAGAAVEPPPAGTIRFYHGASEYANPSEYEAWLTPNEEYARNYRGGPNKVHYVDLTPQEAAALGGIDEINGNRPRNFQADQAISARLQPFSEQPRAAPAEAVQRVVDETHPIAQDVSKRLVEAGRPAEEATAAGQLIAAHYEARAARFEGALGTADELYAAEGAEIKGRKRTKELAQSDGGKELNQAEAPSTPEFKNWFGDSKVVNDAGQPQVVYHGTTAAFDQFDSNKGGAATGAKSAEKGFFFSSSPEVASSYAVGSNVYKDNSFLRFVNKVTGGAYERANEAMLKRIGGRSAIRNGENVMPVYLSIKNPMEIMFDGKEYRERSFASLIDEAKAKGHDGVVFRDAIDPGFEGGEMPSDIYVAFDPKQIKSATGNRGTFDPNSPKIYEQTTRGKIRIREDAKPIITLFKDANESTFVHETGHQWLEELMRDAQHPKAPEGLLTDSKAVLDWFGVKEASEIKTRHHEQFARGFERYMMEGKAPSQGLAKVFAAFRDWLTRIYQTVDRLKSPINDEIRGVFDRLLAVKPEQVKIEPEAPKNFADIHEADALHTAPEAAHPVAETIRQERDRLASEIIPEEHDARLEGVASKAERREAGGPQPLRDGNEAAPAPEAGGNQAAGAVGEGGGAAAPESAGPSAQPRTEVPVSAQEPFKTESPLVDKAGNIRIDNLSTPEDVSQVIRDAAIANNEFIDARRGVITDGQVLELADALGMDEGTLSRRKLGEAFNAEQVMAARKLLIQSATQVRDAMAKAANGTEADVMAYAEVKQRHRMIQEQVAGLTAEAGRALRAFRKLEGQQEAKQLDAFLKDATGKTLFQLQREAQLGMQLETPAQVSKFVNDTTKPSLKDMVIEAWMASLLSGAKTHVANIMGNTISGLWRPLETATAAGIGKVRTAITGSQERVLPGEAAAELFGMIHGSKEGIIAAYKAFKSEEGQVSGARQVEQYNPRALPSATVNVFGKEMEIGGKQARIPLRMLTAEDEFFKSVAFRGDINRQAYALAAKEGLSVERFNARVAELSANPTDAMIDHAKTVAEYQTFQTPLGKVGRSVQQFSNSHLLAKMVVPFVRTPINLLKYAGERTPLGLFSSEVRDNLAGKNGAVARDTQIARITLGTMVGIAAIEMASQGLITGGGPADPKQKAIMRANGWQDYSIKIGEMYYRYNRLDPFSIILGTVADAWEINQALGAKELEKQHLPALIFGAISKNIMERASLKGPSDLIQAVTDPERYGKGYIKGLAGTVVPSIAAQTAQTIDPITREARSVVDGIKARIPGLSQTLMPKRDVWGEPVVREGGLGPDIASPIAESRLKNDPVNKALIAANYFPGKVDRKIRGVELTDQQYDDFARIAGRTAKVRLNAIVSMPGFDQMPESTRKELMTNAITNSRELARSLIMMQNPEIIKKANDAKRANLH